MDSEIFFLKYAFPCAFIIRQRGEIDDEELEELRDAAINSEKLEKEKLEKIFFRAFEKIKPIAQEMNKEVWDIEVLKEYFITRHNEIIEKGMYAYKKAPSVLKNLCKVHVGKVIEKKDNVLIVEYDEGKIRPVINELVPDADVGSNVTIHYGYAVEIID